jgi:hypothetical protein
VVLTKGTGKRLTELDMDQTVADEAEEVLATEPHPGPRTLTGV